MSKTKGELRVDVQRLRAGLIHGWEGGVPWDSEKERCEK